MNFNFLLPLLLGISLFGYTSVETTFSELYKHGVWGKNGFSNSGSQIEFTKIYIDFLQKFMKKHHIASVVDVGCGDWQSFRYIDWAGVEYFGYDVVKFVIERNQRLFAEPSITFIYADAIETDLPKADLLICKDVLQHLSNDKVMKLLTQLDKFKYCLITNDVYPASLSSNNYDIACGGYRPIDLTVSPFNLSAEKVLVWKAALSVKQVLCIESKKQTRDPL